MSKIFLSHASADKPTVRRIAEALRIAGHDPWIDEDIILVGESIPAAIERGLQEADYVVVCLSKAAAERGWVEAERDATVMQQFRSRKARILPVRLEDVSPPYLIGHFRYVDLFPEGAFERGIAELLRAISVHEGAAATPRPTKRAVPNIEGLTPAARQILHEQAFAWEGNFFFQVWLDEWEAASDLRADLTYGVVLGTREPIDAPELMTWISVQFGNITDMVDALGALINSGFQEAMGQPGEPADIAKLAYVARRFAATYREMIQWVLRWRRLHVDEELQHVIALGRECGLSVIRDVDDWAVALKKLRAEFLARGPVDGEEVVFESKLTIRPVNTDEILREFKRVEKIYIRR